MESFFLELNCLLIILVVHQAEQFLYDILVHIEGFLMFFNVLNDILINTYPTKRRLHSPVFDQDVFYRNKVEALLKLSC